MSLLSFLKKSGPVGSTTQVRIDNASDIRELRILRLVPIIGSMSFKGQKKLLSVAIASFATAAVITAIAGTAMTEWSLKRAQLATELEMLSQRIPILGDNATRGEQTSFDILSSAYNQVRDNVTVLKDGRGMMPGTSGEVVKEKLDRYLRLWQNAEPNIQKIQEERETLIEISDIARSIMDDTKVAGELLEKVQIMATQQNIASSDLSLISASANNLESVRSVAEMINNSSALPEGMYGDLVRARQAMASQLTALEKSESMNASESLKTRIRDFKLVQNSTLRDVDRATRILGKVRSARDAVTVLGEKSEMSLKLANDLAGSYLSNDLTISSLVRYGSFALAAITILLGFLLTWIFLVETKHQSSTVEESIMYLMNDLSSIAEGNLTVRARITEDITGAIADSINFTVTQLNSTIYGVNESANKVTVAASSVREKTNEVRDAVLNQAAQIETTANSVLSMTESINSVANATEESAAVADESLVAVSAGREAVEAAISGMEQIRSQIQETSKRIKRLGEAQQEVGEIVTLISDMTEQTNVLALNASIQAAAAGEAGRGFRAVATEVQRLAERSETALKRIVALIQTAQSETQNTIAAMERSTQQVVEGAQTTNRAGEALTQIENVSAKLSQLMENIQQSTAAQTMDAGVISERIHEILLIAKKTSTAMEDAATEIQGINKMADDLKDSVSNFTLS